jgi:hypothetical protein
MNTATIPEGDGEAMEIAEAFDGKFKRKEVEVVVFTRRADEGVDCSLNHWGI